MSSSVRTLSLDGFQKAVASENSKLVVLEFMAPSSWPCNFMKPKLESVAKEMQDKAVFYSLDINEFTDQAAQLGVETLPTFVLVHRSTVKRRVGGTDKDKLKRAIKEEIKDI